jgi:hypothetical protein
MRLHLTILSLFFIVGFASAGGDELAGHWKVTYLKQGQPVNYWLLTIESKDGKLVGVTEPTSSKVLPTTVQKIQIDGDLVGVDFVLPRGPGFRFEGKLPRAGAKKVFGSVDLGDGPKPAYLEATKAKNVFELNQEFLTRSPSDPRVFEIALDLIAEAKERKAAPRDVQEWVEGVLRSAEAYGPAFESDYGLRLVDALHTDFPSLSVEAAKSLDKNLGSRLDPQQKLRLWTTLATALTKAGQADEATKMNARIEAAEEPAYKAYAASSIDFKTPKYEGKVDRPVLVELFTGANCGPCVAADVAFDALEKTYSAGEVVLLQYHMHIPGADPLTASTNDARSDFYGKTFKGTPTFYLNGGALAEMGGSRKDAEDDYKVLREIAEKMMKAPLGAKIDLRAKRKAGEVVIDANVTKLVEEGKLKLHVVLAEDWVRFRGSNGIGYHHMVVRAMPGGAVGFAVGKGLEKSVSVDLAKLRRDHDVYLADVAKILDSTIDKEFPQRPMRLRDLRAVAFVQNEETGEVLASVSVPVKNE